jgi:hypothetical protein
MRRIPAARFFLSGAFAHVVPPPPLEERLAARVEIERAGRRVEEDVDAHVGIARGDRGPAPERAAKVIGHRILHAKRDEVEALHRRAMRVRVDLERALGGEVIAPANVLRALVDVVLVAIGKARDAPKHPARDPRSQVRLVDDVEGSP